MTAPEPEVIALLERQLADEGATMDTDCLVSVNGRDVLTLIAKTRALATRCAAAERALDHVRSQAGAWKQEAVTQRATVNGVGIVLGGIPDYGPIVASVEALTRDLTAARAQVAAMEAWLRNGHDADFSDRWICAPEGANGPVIARGYKFDDITAPTLAELAAALPTPTPQPEQDDA